MGYLKTNPYNFGIMTDPLLHPMGYPTGTFWFNLIILCNSILDNYNTLSRGKVLTIYYRFQMIDTN
jgi:hypothetical protein